jgi:hypothetical protein
MAKKRRFIVEVKEKRSSCGRIIVAVIVIGVVIYFLYRAGIFVKLFG